MMNINIRHLFLAFFIMWTEEVSAGEPYQSGPRCAEQGICGCSFFQQSFSRVLFFFLSAALKIRRFHKWFGKLKCRQPLHQVKQHSIQ